MVEEKLEVSSVPLINHFKRSKFIYDKTHKTFLEMSLHKWKNFISKDVLESMKAIPKLGLTSTMHEENVKRLNHAKLIQIFDRYATYNGSNPYTAPGILNVIPHLEHGFGTFFPKKGMHDIPQSLIRLAKELNVEFYTNETVQEMKEAEGKIIGVVSNSKELKADVVVCNSDVRPAYLHLLKNQKCLRE